MKDFNPFSIMVATVQVSPCRHFSSLKGHWILQGTKCGINRSLKNYVDIWLRVLSPIDKPIHIQLWNSDYERLLNNPYVNEVNLTRQKPPLKCCQLLELLTQLKKENRSLNARNLKSIGQRASKLPAVKLWKKGIDLSMQKILILKVKGLQSN